MRLSVQYSLLIIAVVVLGLGLWTVSVYAQDPIDIGASSPSTPSAPAQGAAPQPGESDPSKGTDCIPPPNKEHRPLKEQSTTIQQEYRTAIKQAIGEEAGEACFKAYMVEGENIEAQPLQENGQCEETDNDCVNSNANDTQDGSGEDAADSSTQGGDTGEQPTDIPGQLPEKPEPSEPNVTCDDDGACTETDPYNKPGEEAQVEYGDDATACSDLDCDGAAKEPGGLIPGQEGKILTPACPTDETCTIDPAKQKLIDAHNESVRNGTTLPETNGLKDDPELAKTLEEYKQQVADGGSGTDGKFKVPPMSSAEQQKFKNILAAECGSGSGEGKNYGYSKCVQVANMMLNYCYDGMQRGLSCASSWGKCLRWSTESYNNTCRNGGAYEGKGSAIRRGETTARTNDANLERALNEALTGPDTAQGRKWNVTTGYNPPSSWNVDKSTFIPAGGNTLYLKNGESPVNRNNFSYGNSAAIVPISEVGAGTEYAGTVISGNQSQSVSSPTNGGTYTQVASNPTAQRIASNFVRSIPRTGIPIIDGAVRQMTGVVNGGTPTGLSSPAGSVGNFGSILGSLLGGGSGSGNSGGSGAFTQTAQPGVGGAVSNLLNTLNPFSSQSGSQQTTNTNTNTVTPQQANQNLNTLLNHQNNQLSQLLNSNPSISQHKTLLQQHRNQLDEFARQYPQANQTDINNWKNMLDQHIQQWTQFEQQQAQSPLATESAHLERSQRLLEQQIDQLNQQITGGGSTNTTPTTNTTVSSDLTIVALRADKTLDDEYRFRGSLSRDLTNANDHLAFSEIGSYFGSNVTHELLLDFGCDGTVDDGLIFVTPYYSILPRSDGADVLLSEYKKVLQDGLHCFAFDVDTANVIPETNEGNNLSSWREFIAGFGASTDSTTLPPLNFEVSAYTANYGTLTQNWTTSDVVISEGQELAFRWDAPQYESCVPLLSSLTPGMADNTSPVERNTLSESVNLHEHTGYYELRCTTGDDTRVETVHVTVN